MYTRKYSVNIITDSDLIRYFTCFDADDGFLILQDDKKFLFVDNRYYFAAKSQAKAQCVLLNENSLSQFINDNNVKFVGIVYEYTTASFLDKLKGLNVEIYDCSEYIFNLTSVKTDSEIEVIKQSSIIAEKSFYQLLPLIKEGVSEKDLKAELEYLMAKNGADKPSFNTIIAFGENSAIPHHKTSNAKLKNNQPVLIDFGSLYGGYCSDMTRTLFFGTPTEDFLKVYDAVKTAHLTAFNKITAGITGKVADGYAREVITNYGYGEYFTHSLGHGIGVKIHESPRLSIKSDYVLKDGNVFSIEPGVYLNGKFGIRIEDTAYLVNGKCVSMMTSDKNPIIL